jgi:hypothetical protein
MTPDTPIPLVITPKELLEHWQGHRRVTRRVIEAFPEHDFFRFSIGGMRPFSALAMEFVRLAVPTIRGITTGDWSWAPPATEPRSRSDVLGLWDETTQEINRLWPTIPPHSFHEVHKAFGQWDGLGYLLVLYVIDNEIHHRGQGYVYLRALGIQPPPFYERD